MSTILIIEDDQILMKACETKLRQEGYEIITANDGDTGLRVALDRKPDVILLDILLPKRDGVSVLHELRNNESYGKDALVVVLTNLSADDPISKEIRALQPADYLVKVEQTPDSIAQRVLKVLKK